MSIDFNELMKRADQAGFTLVPDDEYNGVVSKAEKKPTSTGKEMIAVQFTIEDGPHKDRKLFTQIVLSPDNDNALRFFFEHMTALGFDKSYWGSPGASLDAAAAALPGRRARLVVGHRTWNDADRNEITKIKAPLGGVAPVIGGGVPAGVVVPNASPAMPQVDASSTGAITPAAGGIPQIQPGAPEPF